MRNGGEMLSREQIEEVWVEVLARYRNSVANIYPEAERRLRAPFDMAIAFLEQNAAPQAGQEQSIYALASKLERDRDRLARELEQIEVRELNTITAMTVALSRQSEPVVTEPDAYLIEYREITEAGSKRHVTQASLEPTPPTIMLEWDSGIKSRELLKATPLFRRAELSREKAK